MKGRRPFKSHTSPSPLKGRGIKGVRLINKPYKLLIVEIDGVLLDKHGAVSVEEKRAETKKEEDNDQANSCKLKG